MENPYSHIVVLAEPKLQLVSSWSCRVEIAGVIGIWKFSARVSILESNYVKHLDNGLTFMPVPCTSVIFLFFSFLFLFFLCKLQPMYFKTCNLWIGLQCDWWKLRRAHFCEVPPKKKLFWRSKWHLTGVEDFNIVWRVILGSEWEPGHVVGPRN